jgi:predicted phosphodiesterase
VRLGLISDVHGIEPALRAVVEDGERAGVDRWWALGDLVLFGPHPVEVLLLLHSLPQVEFVSGNTDRYVLTDDQPRPHRTAEEAAGNLDLVRRYGLMAAGAAWTRGVLDEAGVLDLLDDMPAHLLTVLEDGTRLLGVHASPEADDGPGFDTTSSDADLARLLHGVDTDWIVGGHTHDPVDRTVEGTRVLNPGSVGLPRDLGHASWMLIDSSPTSSTVEHRVARFDTASVIEDLNRRRHPNRDFVASVLTRGTFVEAN